jgi:hypothetical protein
MKKALGSVKKMTQNVNNGTLGMGSVKIKLKDL